MSWLSQWIRSKEANTTTTTPPETGTVKNIFSSSLDFLVGQGVKVVEGTKTGQAIEQTAIQEKLRSIYTSPIFIIAVVIGGIWLLKKFWR